MAMLVVMCHTFWHPSMDMCQWAREGKKKWHLGKWKSSATIEKDEFCLNLKVCQVILVLQEDRNANYLKRWIFPMQIHSSKKNGDYHLALLALAVDLDWEGVPKHGRMSSGNSIFHKGGKWKLCLTPDIITFGCGKMLTLLWFCVQKIQ